MKSAPPETLGVLAVLLVPLASRGPIWGGGPVRSRRFSLLLSLTWRFLGGVQGSKYWDPIG